MEWSVAVELVGIIELALVESVWTTVSASDVAVVGGIAMAGLPLEESIIIAVVE